MPPTPLAMTLTATSSVDSLFSDIAQRLGAALHVGLEHDGDAARLRSSICANTSSILRGLLRELDVAELALALQRDFARLALVFDHEEFVAGIGHARQAQHLHRDRRSRRFRPACRSRRTSRARGRTRRPR